MSETVNWNVEKYNQSHEHLRYSGGKRDQLLAGYTAAVGLFGGFKDLDPTAAVVLWAIGVLLLWALIGYRKWHEFHLRFIAILPGLDARKDYKEAWKNHGKLEGGEAKVAIKRLTGGIEAATFWAACVITFVPFSYLIKDASWLKPVPWSWPWAPTLINLIVYTLAVFAISWFALWRGLDGSDGSKLWAFRDPFTPPAPTDRKPAPSVDNVGSG
jgi:hypothetical protein